MTLGGLTPHLILLALLAMTGTASGSDYKECCVENGVSKQCQKLCRLDIDLLDQLDKDKYAGCENYFGVLLKCGSGQRDHTQCCQSNAILPDCTPLCDGAAPATTMNASAKFEGCYDEINFIFDCFTEDHNDIPYPPRNVTTNRGSSADTFTVTWSPPDVKPQEVESYLVHYMPESGRKNPHVITVNGKTFEANATAIKPDTVYGVWVCAETRRGGESHNSNVTYFYPIDNNGKKSTTENPQAENNTTEIPNAGNSTGNPYEVDDNGGNNGGVCFAAGQYVWTIVALTIFVLTNKRPL